MKYYLLLFIVVIPFMTLAQIDTSLSRFSFSGYIEVYYTYDFNKPADHVRPSFIYSHNRHNEVSINLAFLKGSYASERTRANLSIATGTYMNANYAAEQGVLKNMYEANAGVKLSNTKNLWIDAGIFPSHIGFESAVSKDCWSLTRSILADNSPYYESGIKLSYNTNNRKWFLSGLLLNGWQRIQRPVGNNTLAGGTQITYTPNSNITLNYSTFIGNDKPDTAKLMRYFNNFYGIIYLTDNLHVTAGLDYGMEQKSKGSSDFNSWYSPVLLLKIDLDEQWSVTGRAEYYSDENGVIISTGTENGFKTTGYSINIDYKIRENAVFRFEARSLNSKDKIFLKDDEVGNTDTFLTTSIAISL